MVVSGYLYTDDLSTGTAVNTPAWFVWLALGQTFYYKTPMGSFTARYESRRQGSFWYAFHRSKGRLHKIYLGRTDRLTRDVLERAVVLLAI